MSDHPPYGSVATAIDAWWARYQSCYSWAFPGCSYQLVVFGDGPETGRFAGMSLQGTCRGGDQIVGTQYPYKPEKNLGAAPMCVGNPITVGIGNKYARERDVSTNSPSGLVFDRYYNSSPAVAGGSFGPHWRSTFDRTVEYLSDSTVSVARVYRPDGKVMRFTSTNATWVADSDIRDVLAAITDGSGALIGWNYETPSGSETYDANGKLVSITDPKGRVRRMEYDEQNRLRIVNSDFGETLEFIYTATNYVKTMKDHSSRIWTYDYDEFDRLTVITNPDATQRTYHYDEAEFVAAAHSGLLTGITDERGIRYSTYQYDVAGRAISTYHAAGVERVDITYDDAAQSRTVTDSRGNQVLYSITTADGRVLPVSAQGSACGGCGP